VGCRLPRRLEMLLQVHHRLLVLSLPGDASAVSRPGKETHCGRANITFYTSGRRCRGPKTLNACLSRTRLDRVSVIAISPSHHVRYVPRALSMCRFELVGRLILKFQRQHDLPSSFELCDDPRPCRRTKPTKCFMKSSCPWPASSRPSGRKHEYDHQEQETRKHRSTNMFRPRNGLC
jgi:hypothetical protein